MSNRALLLAVAACFAAAACDARKDEPPKPKTAQAVVPLPPEAPKAAAASANQDAKPVQVADTGKPGAAAPAQGKKRPGTKGCGNGKCVVQIKTVTPGKPYCTGTYNAEHLEVAGGSETITWHVAGGWKFDKTGIDLPSGGGQFSGAQGAGDTKYSIVDANTDDKKYKYKIYLTKGSDKCVIDPSIVNGAETIDPNYPPP
jgi:hypothetical protein